MGVRDGIPSDAVIARTAHHWRISPRDAMCHAYGREFSWAEVSEDLPYIQAASHLEDVHGAMERYEAEKRRRAKSKEKGELVNPLSKETISWYDGLKAEVLRTPKPASPRGVSDVPDDLEAPNIGDLE